MSTEHIEIHCHFDLKSISFNNQLTNFFTKSYSAQSFKQLLSNLSLLPSPYRELEEGFEET